LRHLCGVPPQRKKPRKTTPFFADDPPEQDPRVPALLWELPRRIEQANEAGPRYNQTELAHKSGLSQSRISKIASWSNLAGLRLDTIYKLADALDCSLAWLLGEEQALVRRAPARRVSKAARRPASKVTRKPVRKR